jgi:hypothetical protein
MTTRALQCIVGQLCWLLFVAAAGACMTNPLERTQQRTRKDSVTFSGLTPVQRETVAIDIYDYDNRRYSSLATAVSASADGVVDAEGVEWLPWSVDARLPGARNFWQTEGSGTSRYAIAGVRPTGSLGSITTFVTNTCIQRVALETGSGNEIKSQCGTGTTSVLRVPCGDRNEACCPRGAACATGLTCKIDLCVPSSVSVGSMPRPDPRPVIIMNSANTCADTVGGPCLIQPAECFQGATQIMGTIACVNGRPKCTAQHGVDYCNLCDNNLCGGCAMSSCLYDEQCSPGTVCNTYPNAKFCNPIEQSACPRKNGYCWLPKATSMASPPDGAANQDICAL